MSELGKLPRVDRVASHAALAEARARFGMEPVTRRVRSAIDAARDSVRTGRAAPSIEEVATEVARAFAALERARTRSVINATGVVLHTNLGRAPLSVGAAHALAEASRYAALEVDLGTGKRGGRAAFAEAAMAELAAAEAAFFVNNCAAAVLLALSAVAAGRPVIVSRGEAIEIGGGFRVPEVLARSGARMIEVGTTNKTRLDDYARALDAHPDAAAILRVHPANFRMTGFVAKPALDELASLARSRGVLLVKDLGGGALVDLEALGLRGEPTVRSCVEAGAHLVCFSTDKLLGGPQGGAIVGDRALVDRLRGDPLARALRLGRLPLVALEATLAAYLEGRLDDVPTVAALRLPIERVRARAVTWRDTLLQRGVSCGLVDLVGAAGGGTLAEEALASFGVALEGDAERWASRLRARDVPVFGRVVEGRFVLDARTVLPGEDGALIEAVVGAW